MAVKLIMTDIDGTILPYGQRVVSDRTRAAFHAARDAGIHIGPASGRFAGMLPMLFNGDETCCATAVASNGLQILCDGELVMQQLFDPQDIRDLIDVLGEERHTGLLLYVDGEMFLSAGSRDDLAIAYPAYAKTVADLERFPDGGIMKANVFCTGDLESTRALASRLHAAVPALDVDVPQPLFLNVMPAGWNKGTGLTWLMDYLGLGRNEVVVFGDGGNDLELFSAAEHSVAVEAAMSEAASAARWHIGAVEDDAVAAAIEALAVGEWPFFE